MDITDYRLSLFTIFNNAALHSMDPKAFQYNAPEEQDNTIINLKELALKRGLSL